MANMTTLDALLESKENPTYEEFEAALDIDITENLKELSDEIFSNAHDNMSAEQFESFKNNIPLFAPYFTMSYFKGCSDTTDMLIPRFKELFKK